MAASLVFEREGGPTGLNRERGESFGWDLRGNGGNGDGSFLAEGKRATRPLEKMGALVF